jgi:hypothetical protein
MNGRKLASPATILFLLVPASLDAQSGSSRT